MQHATAQFTLELRRPSPKLSLVPDHTSNQSVIFEQPLNERMRTLLRLEFLFLQTDHSRNGHHAWDARASLDGLFDILEVGGRTELRQDLVKELERQAKALTKFGDVPGVDTEMLQQSINNLETTASHLSQSIAQGNHPFANNELLTALKQRRAIPGGCCAFDLPELHAWLQTPTKQLNQQISHWFEPMASLRQTVDLLLEFTRNSTILHQHDSEMGFYQQELDGSRPYQLIRVQLPPEADCFPEISGGKHRFTIRFMRQATPSSRPVQVTSDLSFGLGLCLI